MTRARDPDELTMLFVSVRSFFASWLVLLIAVVAGWVVFGVALELWMVATAGKGSDGEGEHPLTLSVLWAFGAVIAAVAAGPALVLLRRHIVQPDFPFLRPGYAAVAVLPFGLFGLAMESEPGWYWIPLYLQAPLLLTALIYIVLARRFGLFAPEEGSHPPGLVARDGGPPATP